MVPLVSLRYPFPFQTWALAAILVSLAARGTLASSAYGCLFEESLCVTGEKCIDDGVFGGCEPASTSHSDWIQLDDESTLLLESELARLWKAGYRWTHEYSQCVVGALLDSIRRERLYDPGFCARALKIGLPVISEELAEELSNVDPADQALIRFTPNLPLRKDQDSLLPATQGTFADEVFLPPLVDDDGGQKAKVGGKGGAKPTQDPEEELRRLELESDNRIARDIQQNLWTGYDKRSLDVVEEENLPLPVEKRSNADIGQFWDEANDQPEVNDGNLLDVIDYLESIDSVSPTMQKQTSSPMYEDVLRSDEDEEDPPVAMYATAPDNSDLVPNLRTRGDPFIRPMRLDIKKPGPSYFIRERDSTENQDEYDDRMRRLMQRGAMAEKTQSTEEMQFLDPFKDLEQNNEKREAERVLMQPSRVAEISNGLKKMDPYNPGKGIQTVDANTAYLRVTNVNTGTVDHDDARRLTTTLEHLFELPTGTISNMRLNGDEVSFKLNPNLSSLNASEMVSRIDSKSDEILRKTNLSIKVAGIGEKVKYELISGRSGDLFLFTFVVCGSVVGVLLAISVIYVIRRHQLTKQKLHGLEGEDGLAKFDYQDLCRQRMADSAAKEGSGPLAAAMESGKVHQSPKKVKIVSQQSDSSRSSTSSWSEEPVTSNMDISTGHMILAYMEDHLKSKNRLEQEWESLCAYEADPNSTTTASQQQNIKKNRYPDILPFDHARVILNEASNASNSDYVNASSITDHDPRNPAYIATQGPLAHTASDFWQMVWEQGSVVIVTLSRLMENGVSMCHRYWPEEGSEVYNLYEVHLVSEHIWCDDYLVRSFYLKNLKTAETRTVTQFHFLSWPDNGIPPSVKALLEFRRKVNKSYRGRSCPIVVHCSDGAGRTGTYVLLDMVLNRIAKGAKEIDVAATLEHVRDQRMNMVKTKAQFELVLMAIAEEVHAIVKALSKE